MAKDHRVNLEAVRATGASGRITKNDMLRHLADLDARQRPPQAERRAWRPVQPSPVDAGPVEPERVEHPPDGCDRVERVPMSAMRRTIAAHMVRSAHTSPHAYAVYEVDVGRLSKLREAKKPEFARLGAKLTFTALIARVLVDALGHFPVINTSLDGDIVHARDVHLGIAVALEDGLIVRWSDTRMSRTCWDCADR